MAGGALSELGVVSPSRESRTRGRVIPFAAALRSNVKTCPRCGRSDRTLLGRYVNPSRLGLVGVIACEECASNLRTDGIVLDWVGYVR